MITTGKLRKKFYRDERSLAGSYIANYSMSLPAMGVEVGKW